jgi:hypothetical protein
MEVHVNHAGGFALPIGDVALDNAQRVDPEIAKPKEAGESNGIVKGRRELRYGNRFFPTRQVLRGSLRRTTPRRTQAPAVTECDILSLLSRGRLVEAYYPIRGDIIARVPPEVEQARREAPSPRVSLAVL